MTGGRRRKRLGHHFLHDPRVIDRIISAISPERRTPIVDIGPGRGALTLPLLKRTGLLYVIEIDAGLAGELQARCAGIGDLRIYIADALRFDFSKLGADKLKVVGNLPYSVSTPLLFHLLAQAGSISEMIFMLQREVVARMCAPAGSHDYGRLSVMIQSRCDVTELFDVGRGAFSPPPRVDSAVVRLVPNEKFANSLKDAALFAQVVKLAFGQRRKKLRNAMKELLPHADAALAEAGVSPDVRAEEVTVQQFGMIANALAEVTTDSRI